MATPSIREQQAFYDEHWSGFAYAGSYKVVRAAAILSMLGRVGIESPRIADLGAGAGWLTGVLSQFGPTTGVELSGAAVTAAQARLPGARFEQADLATWTTDERFDVVVSQEVIEHLEDQRHHLDLAREILVPGGWLILTAPSRAAMEAMPDPRAHSDQPIEDWPTRRRLTELTKAAGFDIVAFTTVIPDYPATGWRGIVSGPKLRAVAERLGRDEWWRAVRNRAGLGLHFVLLAQRR